MRAYKVVVSDRTIHTKCHEAIMGSDSTATNNIATHEQGNTTSEPPAFSTPVVHPFQPDSANVGA
jgi:hypothetical protein